MITKEQFEKRNTLQNDRIALIEKTLDAALLALKGGEQQAIQVSSQNGDEPEILKLLARYKEQLGITMTYHFEEARGKEYVLIWARQTPAR